MEQTRASGMGRKCIILIAVFITLLGCKNDQSEPVEIDEFAAIIPPEELKEFGFNLNDYIVKRDTIRKGESFGVIMERYKIGYPKIFQIAEETKNDFDIRKLQLGKPYTVLCSKDSLQQALSFIYQPNREEYVVLNFKDSIHAFTSRKPITYVEKEFAGVITSDLSQTLSDGGKSLLLAYKMSDIYAWTIDFTRLQKGDHFKIIYTDKYIDDTLYAGIDNIKAAYFEHKSEPFYAFEFQTDSVKRITDYFNEEAKNLRRAFLKAPVEYKRITSRYNLKRRIALYGNRIRPHKGTDFSANIGTPIRSTANGTVTKSAYTRGNGNYVKIRHNSTYETQYLHMKKQNVKVGQHVKQGDVIGWVGMTGNTSGPHVCYRFWKNGKQVDPFKQKLPESEPISDSLKVRYLDFIKPLKIQLDAIKVQESNSLESTPEDLITQLD